jgi:hypothetical protein
MSQLELNIATGVGLVFLALFFFIVTAPWGDE